MDTTPSDRFTIAEGMFSFPCVSSTSTETSWHRASTQDLLLSDWSSHSSVSFGDLSSNPNLTLIHYLGHQGHDFLTCIIGRPNIFHKAAVKISEIINIKFLAQGKPLVTTDSLPRLCSGYAHSCFICLQSSKVPHAFY